MATFTRATAQMVRRRANASPTPSPPPTLKSHSEAVGASTWEASIAVARPASVATGDLLVAICASRNNRSWSDAHGFTELVDLGVNPCLRVAWKLAGAAEPASYVFTPSGNSALVAQVLCFADAALGTVGEVGTLSGDGNVPLPAIAAATDGLLLAMLADGEASAATIGVPAGMTATSPQVDVGAIQLRSFTEAIAAGSTGARNCPVSGTSSGTSAGLLLALAPA